MKELYYGEIYKSVVVEVYVIPIKMLSNGYIEFEVVGEDKQYKREITPEVFKSVYRLQVC